MTHKSARGLSRTDRVYLNPHVADQACKPWTVTALAWPGDLSAHRPLEVARRLRQLPAGEGAVPPVPQCPLSHPDWKKRVELHWGELRKQDLLADTPARRLLLLKDAIRETTWAMHFEGSIGMLQTRGTASE